MQELPYFLYYILVESAQTRGVGCKIHPSWCEEQVRKESEHLLLELQCMEGSRNDPIQQLCLSIMERSEYQIEASLWMHSMELLLCKYCH